MTRLFRHVDFRRAGVLVTVLSIAIHLFGCQKTDPSLRSPLGVGAVAPEIVATGWINGAPQSFEGQVVVLDCWAHW